MKAVLEALNNKNFPKLEQLDFYNISLSGENIGMDVFKYLDPAIKNISFHNCKVPVNDLGKLFLALKDKDVRSLKIMGNYSAFSLIENNKAFINIKGLKSFKELGIEAWFKNCSLISDFLKVINGINNIESLDFRPDTVEFYKEKNLFEPLKDNKKIK